HQISVLENAVLERDHRRLRSNDRPDLVDRRFRVPQLDGKYDKVDDADHRRVLDRIHARQANLIRAAFDRKTLFAHGSEVRAARPTTPPPAPPLTSRPPK